MPELPTRTPIAQEPISLILLPDPSSDDRVQSIWDMTRLLGDIKNDCEIISFSATGLGDDSNVNSEPREPVRRTRVLHCDAQAGIGELLRAGLAAAQYPLVAYFEYNDAYRASDLTKMLEAIDHVDLVAGYRVNAKGKRPREVHDFLYRWMARLLFGVCLRDVNCCFKLFRREIFARIPVQSSGILAHAEILAKANFLGCLMSEVDVAYQHASSTSPVLEKAWHKEVATLFHHPDFGPAMLPAKESVPFGMEGKSTS